MNYTLSEIARITGGEFIGKDVPVNGVLIDSRSGIDVSDPVFVALSGKNRDGNDYVGQMYGRGVRAFLVSRKPDNTACPDAGFILIDDTLDALQRWAGTHRRRTTATVVGITGSNGKTVVKEWIAQLAPDGKKVFRSPKSYNSQIGVALSLLMLEGNEDVAIIEAGISMPDEMAKLERMVAPEVVLVTNIGPPHRENFTDDQYKLNEKLILARNCDTIIYPQGHPLIKDTVEQRFSDRNRIEAGSDYDARMPFKDPVSVKNARMALRLWLTLGVDPEEVVPKLASLQPVAMRMELLEGIGGAKILNDSYNADVRSLSMALDSLRSVGGTQKRVLILSDIYQTGLADNELYAEVARLAEHAEIDSFIGIGERISACSHLFRGTKAFYDTTEAFIKNLNRTDFIHKAILIKGSRPFRFERISRMLEKQVHTTVLEVDLDAMIRNLNHYRSKLDSGVRIMVMVKALAYGSGSFEVAATLQHQGVAYLAVAFADEGVSLREAGITMPIVVLNADDGSFGTMIDYRLEPEIYNFTSLTQFMSELRHRGELNYPIHISFDTGMHRLGFMEDETERLTAILKHTDTVYIRSVFTHFAVSDEPCQDEFTRMQIESIHRIGDRLKSAFPKSEILLHASNSAGIERFPSARFDMVRLGIGLYGISSFEQGLEAVGVLKSRIVQIKHLKSGDTVGYGRHGKIERDTVTATIPVGYADGLDRRLGRGAWSFQVHGNPAPTIGNICMDTCMIDITGIDAAEGDEVIIFGGASNIKAMADVLETIPYEVLTSVSSRVKRIFVKE